VIATEFVIDDYTHKTKCRPVLAKTIHSEFLDKRVNVKFYDYSFLNLDFR